MAYNDQSPLLVFARASNQLGNLVSVAAPGSNNHNGVALNNGELLLITSGGSSLDIPTGNSASCGLWVWNGTASPLTRPQFFRSGMRVDQMLVVVAEGNGATAGSGQPNVTTGPGIYRLVGPVTAVDTTSHRWSKIVPLSEFGGGASNTRLRGLSFSPITFSNSSSISLGTGTVQDTTDSFIQRFTGSTASTRTLPADPTYQTWLFINSGTALLTIAPASGTINGLASISVPPGRFALVHGASSSVTYAQVFGSNGGTRALTATATLLSTDPRLISYNGPLSQTITLPPAIPGTEHEIFNVGANAVSIARGGTDTVGGATTPINLDPAVIGRFICMVAGDWVVKF